MARHRTGSSFTLSLGSGGRNGPRRSNPLMAALEFRARRRKAVRKRRGAPRRQGLPLSDCHGPVLGIVAVLSEDGPHQRAHYHHDHAKGQTGIEDDY
jgi:hypothetical protein